MMQDTSHLNALRVRLSHEQDRLNRAKSFQEKELRTVWVKGIQKEITDELKFLGLEEKLPEEMTDDELLAELMKDSE